MRRGHGRLEETSLLITDAQSVKNTDTAELKGYDGGKQVSGIKRHLCVDTEGLPHAIYVTTANITDRAGALEMVWRYQSQLPRVLKLVVDGGYSGPGFAASIEHLLGAVVEVAKRSELHRFKVMPKRWVVERDYAWLEKQRRLWKNCERKITTSEQMIALAFVAILLRRL